MTKKRYICPYSWCAMIIQENHPTLKFSDDFFESAFNYYSSGLLVYAKHYVQLYEVAEDIVHDVFVGYWEKKHSVASDKIKSYLFTATRNSCLNHLSHLKMRTRFQDEILAGGKLPDSFDEDCYIPVEMKALIDAAIERLPSQRRKVFIMSKLEGKTFNQVAEELKISPKTVDKHLELALKDLRKDLAQTLCLTPLGTFLFSLLLH